MPQYINSKARVMECFLERLVKNFPVGQFILIHDGSTQPQDVQLLQKPTFFTRTYQWIVDGEPVNTQVRFKYDLRTGFADMSITNMSLQEFEAHLSKIEGNSSAQERLTHIRETLQQGEVKQW